MADDGMEGLVAVARVRAALERLVMECRPQPGHHLCAAPSHAAHEEAMLALEHFERWKYRGCWT